MESDHIIRITCNQFLPYSNSRTKKNYWYKDAARNFWRFELHPVSKLLSGKYGEENLVATWVFMNVCTWVCVPLYSKCQMFHFCVQYSDLFDETEKNSFILRDDSGLRQTDVLVHSWYLVNPAHIKTTPLSHLNTSINAD